MARIDDESAARPSEPGPPGEPNPLTRREARALREAHERSASRRTRSRSRVRSVVARVHAVPAAAPAARAARSASAPRRLFMTTAASAALAMIPGLMFALPANAAPSTLASSTLSAMTAETHARERSVAQILSVASDATGPTAQQADEIGRALAGVMVTEGGGDAQTAAVAISGALQIGGKRQTIVETALGYLGTPYVLGGDSHAGIDCSGLTMVAYAAVGIPLFHGVIAQDADGVRIPESDAQPGDLVVFDDDEHVALYLGGGVLIAAPEAGRDVQIEKLSSWSSIPYHFTRILPASAD